MKGLKIHWMCWLILLFACPSPTAPAQAVREHPAAYYFAQGESLVEKRKWEEALEAFNLCLARNPLFVDAYYARGLVREHFNLNEDALTDYNVYVALRPEHHEALVSRAQLRLKLGLHQLAKEDFLKLLDMPTGPTSTVFFRQDIFTGHVSQVFTAQSSDKGYLFNLLGHSETGLGNFANAIIDFDSAIARSPTDADLRVNRGIAKEKSGELEGALQDYRYALVIQPGHALAKHNLAAMHKKLNLKSDPVELLNAAIEESPEMPYAYAERAFIRMENGDWERALQDYNHAIRIDPSEEEHFLNRGLVKEKLKDLKGAYSDYTQAINLKEDYEKAWLNRANLLSRLNRFDEAVEDYTVAIHHHPGYANAYYNRALAKQRLREMDGACLDLKKAEEFGMSVQGKVKMRLCSPDPSVENKTKKSQ